MPSQHDNELVQGDNCSCSYVHYALLNPREPAAWSKMCLPIERYIQVSHSPNIGGPCLMKCPSKTLHNLVHFLYTYTLTFSILIQTPGHLSEANIQVLGYIFRHFARHFIKQKRSSYVVSALKKSNNFCSNSGIFEGKFHSFPNTFVKFGKIDMCPFFFFKKIKTQKFLPYFFHIHRTQNLRLFSEFVEIADKCQCVDGWSKSSCGCVVVSRSRGGGTCRRCKWPAKTITTVSKKVPKCVATSHFFSSFSVFLLKLRQNYDHHQL